MVLEAPQRLLLFSCIFRCHAQTAWPASGPELCAVPSTLPVRPDSTCSDFGHGSSCEETKIDIAAQRGEIESAQLLLRHASDQDTSGGLTNVSVRILGLQASIATAYAFQVGFVNTLHSPRYQGSGGGWRPDPLLPPPADGIGFDVAPDQSQPIWIEIHIDAAAAPGEHKAAVVIDCDDRYCKKLPQIPLHLTVWDIELPSLATSTLGTAWSGTWTVAAFADYYGDEYWRNETNRHQWYDLLLQSRTPPDSIYQAPPELRPIADYVYLASKGVKWFAILDVTQLPSTPDDSVPRLQPRHTGRMPLPHVMGSCQNYTDEYVERLIATLRPIVKSLEVAGIVDRAYIYGFDENPVECEPQVRKLFGATKRAFPRLQTAAVLNWSPMPVDLPVDIWVLQYQEFQSKDVQQWIAAGKVQWQYHCIEPSSMRYLNTFIERRPIQPRLLFWLAALVQAHYGAPSGWLYYAVNLWSPCNSTACGGKHKPHVMSRKQFLDPSDKHSGFKHLAFTDFPPANYIWQPQYTDIFVNGDGQYLYPCAGGPCSSARLSAIRDGLEDWELFSRLKSHESIPLLKRLVRSATDWTEDPVLLESTRREAAKLLLLAQGEQQQTGIFL